MYVCVSFSLCGSWKFMPCEGSLLCVYFNKIRSLSMHGLTSSEKGQKISIGKGMSLGAPSYFHLLERARQQKYLIYHVGTHACSPQNGVPLWNIININWNDKMYCQRRHVRFNGVHKKILFPHENWGYFATYRQSFPSYFFTCILVDMREKSLN